MDQDSSNECDVNTVEAEEKARQRAAAEAKARAAIEHLQKVLPEIRRKHGMDWED